MNVNVLSLIIEIDILKDVNFDAHNIKYKSMDNVSIVPCIVKIMETMYVSAMKDMNIIILFAKKKSPWCAIRVIILSTISVQDVQKGASLVNLRIFVKYVILMAIIWLEEDAIKFVEMEKLWEKKPVMMEINWVLMDALHRAKKKLGFSVMEGHPFVYQYVEMD